MLTFPPLTFLRWSRKAIDLAILFLFVLAETCGKFAQHCVRDVGRNDDGENENGEDGNKTVGMQFRKIWDTSEIGQYTPATIWRKALDPFPGPGPSGCHDMESNIQLANLMVSIVDPSTNTSQLAVQPHWNLKENNSWTWEEPI